VATGLLHDVVEDTLVDLDTIPSLLGEEITHLVDGLTKIAQISNISREEQQAENVRKMLLAMIDDVRVVLVKLADRLHNMRTLHYLNPEKRKRIAEETMEIFAPIAHRLGMGKLRGELEDLAFRHLHPDDYRELAEQLEKRRPENEAFLKGVTARIEEKMNESEVPFVIVEGRVKRLYSIWKKLRRQKISLDQVYDLVAARIITQTRCAIVTPRWESCTTTGSPCRAASKTGSQRPRDNLYQSLHTSVIGSGGQSFEVQIRTEEMHHSPRKASPLTGNTRKENARRARGRSGFSSACAQLVEWTQEVKDSKDFLDSLKLDLYPKDVYAFTPMGKVIPVAARRHARRLRLHDSLGSREHMHGRAHQQPLVPLRTPNPNGDVVEIVTTTN
jgi:GTP pyrophosphokinase